MKYVEPLFRPPAEAGSLIFQVAFGCPHNRCRFCGMYKGVRHRLRPEPELLQEIAEAGRRCPGAVRFFLADGDVMALPFERLRRILLAIRIAFPAGRPGLASTPTAVRFWPGRQGNWPNCARSDFTRSISDWRAAASRFWTSLRKRSRSTVWLRRSAGRGKRGCTPR